MPGRIGKTGRNGPAERRGKRGRQSVRKADGQKTFARNKRSAPKGRRAREIMRIKNGGAGAGTRHGLKLGYAWLSLIREKGKQGGIGLLERTRRMKNGRGKQIGFAAHQ